MNTERRVQDLLRPAASLVAVGVLSGMLGCAPSKPTNPYVPAMRYAVNPSDKELTWKGGAYRPDPGGGHAHVGFVEAERPPTTQRPTIQPEPDVAIGHQVGDRASLREGDIRVIRGEAQRPRAYQGPLLLGDPGVSSSLWRESRGGNEVFRDYRAWQAMDLVTIVVTERSRGMHDADTEVKSNSQVLAAIQNFFGYEAPGELSKIFDPPPNVNSWIRANTLNNFKGEGLTNRQAELTARLSAVVVEVLPSGLLRIEGEKIISVNNEEQVMVVSGLVRQRDINSLNEVDSSKIAQMRIDYYGRGTVSEAQFGGWFARLMRILWPF